MFRTTVDDSFEGKDGFKRECGKCGVSLINNTNEFCGVDDEGKPWCEKCTAEYESECAQEERQIGEELAKHVRLTSTPVPYARWSEGRTIPTPDEYERGFRESGSLRAYAAYIRHRCTNYESLLVQLPDCDVSSDGYYAIRAAVELIVDPFIEEVLDLPPLDPDDLTDN